MSKVEITLHNAFYHMSLKYSEKRQPKCFFCGHGCRQWHSIIAASDEEHDQRIGRPMCCRCASNVESARDTAAHLPAHEWEKLIIDPVGGEITAKKTEAA